MSTPARLRLAAIDLGAESGRVMVGGFDGDRLRLEQAHRFPNVPVAVGGTLHWDVLRLFGDVSAGLGRAAAVQVTVFDLLGRTVRRIETGVLSAGNHAVRLRGDGLHAGLYLIRVEADGGAAFVTATVTR